MTSTSTATGKTGQRNKQMEGGCMAGFFNFSHLLTGKRSYLKRLPPPLLSENDVAGNSTSDVVGPPALPDQSEKSSQLVHRSPESDLRSPDPDPVPKSTVSAFEFKEQPVKSPWKFVKESPRLSLDSRAVTDGKGGLWISSDEDRDNHRRSPCVIARLMGLEQPETAEKKVELRRSASESRSRDYRFLEINNNNNSSFLFSHSNKNEFAIERKSDQSLKINHNVVKVKKSNHQKPKMKNQNQNQNQNQNGNGNGNGNQRRKSFYDSADFFPPDKHKQQQVQQQQHHDPSNSKDLETLKNILEALQLKGLLHSSSSAAAASPVSRRNRESPIVVITPTASPRRERPPPARNSDRSSSPPVRRKGGPLSVETQRRRGSHSPPVQSPKMMRSDRTVTLSPRGRRSSVENCRGGERMCCRSGPGEDELASTVSESSFSASSHTENEKLRGGEEYREGKSLLERCDKLLHSIAEMNSNSNCNSAELQQPSPVSVLDSSFYKEDESSPSPVKKRSIHFKDQLAPELEDELWSPSSLSSSSSRTQLTSYPDHHGIDPSSLDDPDFIYISKVFKASNYLPDEPDLFLLLEKQAVNKEENSKVSFLHRKIIFDTITEILNRTRNLPAWKSGPQRLSLGQIWTEFQRFRELGPAQDLFEVIIGVLKKDLAQDSVTGWGHCPMEISEAVLDIERLIFKDLIGESIEDLAAIAGKNMGAQKYCRKLVF